MKQEACPLSSSIVQLHKLQAMKPRIRDEVVRRLSRKSLSRKNWKPANVAAICNLHYENHTGPTRSDLNGLPSLFSHKRFKEVERERCLSKSLTMYYYPDVYC